MARLNHPHIVQVYEIGEYQSQPFVALELVDGGTLARKLGGTPLPPQQAADLVVILARAMDAVHRCKVMHRDLKPGNILLTMDDTPKISDFGLSKKLDVESGQTRSEAIMGTPSYMAPEQAAGRAKEVGPAADIYALGAILYEMLTGRPPFRAPTVLETLQQVMTQEPVPPRRLQSGCPRDLETICLQCLRKEPRERYANALQLAEDLQHFLKGEPIKARPVGRMERLLMWARRRPTLAAVYGLLLLAVMLAAGTGSVTWLWQRAEDARDHEKSLREQADQARQDAAEARDALEMVNENMDQVLYLRRVSLAQAEWRGNEIGRVDQLLRECPLDRRRWEWNYLHRLCHSDLRTFHVQAAALDFSADRQRLTIAEGNGKVVVWDVQTGIGQKNIAFRGKEGRIGPWPSVRTASGWPSSTQPGR